jgi:toxin CptA
VVTAGIFVALRDAKLKLAHSCVAFKLEAENRITLMLRNGQYLTGDISSGGVVTPFLLLLNMKSSDYGSRNLVLLPDSMGSDDFRRLRVLLSWDKSAV